MTLTSSRVRQELKVSRVVPLAQVGKMLPGLERQGLCRRSSASTALEALLEVADMPGRSGGRGGAGESQGRGDEVSPMHLEKQTGWEAADGWSQEQKRGICQGQGPRSHIWQLNYAIVA